MYPFDFLSSFGRSCLKTETATLNYGHRNDGYSKYDIQAKDRRKYEELFNYEKYTIDEILKITYGKKEIYTKEQ